MDHSRKIFYIVSICIVLIAVFSGVVLYKNVRPTKGLSYEQITMEQAAEYMGYGSDYILVDVREPEEYDQGHIPGAICIPQGLIEMQAPEKLQDKEQMIYAYCRSGNRSKTASQKLCDLGYTNITEIGGILDWTGETEK